MLRRPHQQNAALDLGYVLITFKSFQSKQCETVVNTFLWWLLLKIMFCKTSQIFQESICGSLFFVKLQTLMPSVSSPSKCFPVNKLIWICSLIVSFQSKFLFLNRSDLRTDQYPAANYIFKVNDRNIRTMCEICLMLTIKIPLSLLLTLNTFHTLFYC